MVGRFLSWWGVLVAVTLGACGGRSGLKGGFADDDDGNGGSGARGGSVATGGATGGSGGSTGGVVASGGVDTGGVATGGVGTGAVGGSTPVAGAPSGGSAGVAGGAFGGGAGEPIGGSSGSGGTAGMDPTGGTAGMPSEGCRPATPDLVVSVATQEELEGFRGVSEVHSVVVTGSVSDLSPLSCLTRVLDGLNVGGTTLLSSLHGLEKLERVGSLNVWEANLSSLDGLGALHTIDGSFSLRDASLLSSLSGLSALQAVQAVHVVNCPLVSTIDGFSKVTSLDWLVVEHSGVTVLDGFDSLSSIGDLEVFSNDRLELVVLPAVATANVIALSENHALARVEMGGLGQVGRMYLGNNALTSVDFSALTLVVEELNLSSNYLTNLDDLDSLAQVQGTFDLTDNELANVHGLSSLQKIGGGFYLGLNRLGDLTGLNALSSIGDILVLDDNPLTSLTGLENLESAWGIYLHANDIADVEPLSGLTSLGGFNATSCPYLETLGGLRGLVGLEVLELSDAPLLADLDGLQNLAFVSTVYLSLVPALTTLDALSGLTQVGALTVYDAASLGSIDGLQGLHVLGALTLDTLPVSSLSALSGLSTLNSLYLGNLPNLTSLDVFAGLATAPNDIQLRDLPALTNVHGLSEVEWVWTFSLTRTGVTDLTGLDGLIYCSYGFILEQNPALATLRAVSKLERASNIVIVDNAVLPTCDAEWLLGRATYDGASIFGNDDDGICP